MESQKYESSYQAYGVLEEAQKIIEIVSEKLYNRKLMVGSSRFSVSSLPKACCHFIDRASKSLAITVFVALWVLSVVSVALGNALSKGEVK
ncbi:hypothetical protein V7114_26455 [Neobacillus niacini]|uniref:hypothetical protein n=1 Tax=Neobacillus niacini TaxID=86668 RepID=UPI002FFD8A63